MANLTNQLAEKLSNLGVKAVYGQPIEVDGATIVPVAVASFGFGATEQGTQDQKHPAGGGGGGYSAPVGAYITRNGVTRFEPNPVAVMTVAIPLTLVAGFVAGRIITRLKR